MPSIEDLFQNQFAGFPAGVPTTDFINNPPGAFKNPFNNPNIGEESGFISKLADPLNFFGLNPTAQDRSRMILEDQLGQFGLGTLGGSQNILMPLLLDLLSNQGRTDPRAMNLQLSDIARGSQGAQQSTQGQLASLGLSGSGVGQAISAAQGQAGLERRSRAIAAEDQAAEERRRRDLLLFSQLVQQPGLEALALALGQGQFASQQQANQKGGLLAGIGSLIGGF